jgi:hypothetical protein
MSRINPRVVLSHPTRANYGHLKKFVSHRLRRLRDKRRVVPVGE